MVNEAKSSRRAEEQARPDWFYIVFDWFYTAWAAIALPLLVAVLGFFAYLWIGQSWVIVATIVGCVLALGAGVLLARFLRRAGEGRGGIAGSMAPHASPDLDKDPESEGSDYN